MNILKLKLFSFIFINIFDALTDAKDYQTSLYGI